MGFSNVFPFTNLLCGHDDIHQFSNARMHGRGMLIFYPYTSLGKMGSAAECSAFALGSLQQAPLFQ